MNTYVWGKSYGYIDFGSIHSFKECLLGVLEHIPLVNGMTVLSKFLLQYQGDITNMLR